MLLGRKRPHSNQNTMKSNGIVDPQSHLEEKRSKEVMEIFQQQTTLVPNVNKLPTAKLNNKADLSSYQTPLLKKYSADFNFIWNLAVALYKDGVQNWLRDLVFPGLATQLEINQKQNPTDTFVTTFTYLSFGQLDLACTEAKKNQDHKLAMYISHSQYKDVKEMVKDHMDNVMAQRQWEKMTPYHKRCWYILAGHLGYSDTDELVVTAKVNWQCTLAMYIWYGNRFGESLSLDSYNSVFDSTIGNIHHLITKKYTAKPNEKCLWYQLLQWWIGDKSIAKLNTWPSDLVWLLSIYKPINPIDLTLQLRWINQLERIDQSELAIYASLFLSEYRDAQVDYILRQCEWTDENKLLNVYHIPSAIICKAKALNAHDDWNFDGEFNILIQGGLYEQAKMSLYRFILPRYFAYDTESIEKCLSFIHAFPQKTDPFIIGMEEILTYLLNDDKNHDTSNLLAEKLKQLLPKREGRNIEELFNNLMKAILL